MTKNARTAIVTTMEMPGSVSHGPREETPEAKARWFQSLPMSQRMELFCAFTDPALAINP